MYKTIIAAVLVLGIYAGVCSSDNTTPAPQPDLKKLSEKIIDLLGHRDNAGYKLIHDYELCVPNDDEWGFLTRQVSRDLLRHEESFGRYLICEVIEERNVKETFRKYVLIAKYERNAIVWNLTFYRPQDKWKLHTWTYTQSLDVLFK
jgi:hypothetical protein